MSSIVRLGVLHFYDPSCADILQAGQVLCELAQVGDTAIAALTVRGTGAISR